MTKTIVMGDQFLKDFMNIGYSNTLAVLPPVFMFSLESGRFKILRKTKQTLRFAQDQ